ncbi:hypothetical protein GJ744_000543 [Endocarpon pusillum]|uniref:Uncharacterized protein n=1 Tax=Endocarpon pusillum TaxID=364733 RepID=A0A8H7ACT3_9EURO|nr:hypothetical protein GJ744_000543 [Endocarpon pusillum]
MRGELYDQLHAVKRSGSHSTDLKRHDENEANRLREANENLQKDLKYAHVLNTVLPLLAELTSSGDSEWL